MSVFSSYKKIFLLGFIIVILVAIPFSVYIAQKRQQITSKAAASTVLSFEPASSTIKVGDTLSIEVVLDPGSGPSANQVSFVKLIINFDSSKFAIVSGSLAPNSSSSNTLTTLEGPTYTPTTASISLFSGADPTRIIANKTKIAVLKLKALSPTDVNNPSSITFESGTQVLSIASLDQTGENVLSTTSPATVAITSAAISTTPTPSLSPTATPSTISSLSPTPTSAAPRAGGGLGGGGLPSPSLVPVCSSLEVNGLTSGTAPYSLIFTATGSDSDGTIRKISFNFGDSVEDLTGGGGIGTSSVSAQIFHTYKTSGIYTAYAILTDNNNNLSVQQNSCTRTITISSELGQPSQPSLTLPPTGDGKIIVGLGALGIILTIIGGALLLL